MLSVSLNPARTQPVDCIRASHTRPAFPSHLVRNIRGCRARARPAFSPAPLQQSTLCSLERRGTRHPRTIPAGAGDKGATTTGEVLVEEVMNPHPVILSLDTPVKEAVRLFLDEDISGAPVVDKAGKLVGILSESDLIWKGVGAPQDHFIIPPVYIGLADVMLAWRDNAAFQEEVHKILAKTVSNGGEFPGG